MSQLPKQMKDNASEAASFLKAVAHPARLMILCMLHDGEKSVGEMLDHLPLSDTATSQHLARMRSEGLIDYRRDHRTLYYYIADPNCRTLLKLLAKQFCG